MEYKGIYDVNRPIHVRPLCQIVKKSIDIYSIYPNIEIKIRNLSEPDRSSNRTPLIIGCISLELVFMGTQPSQIEVIVSGDYSEEILKKCTDDIGNILAEKSDDNTY